MELDLPQSRQGFSFLQSPPEADQPTAYRYAVMGARQKRRLIIATKDNDFYDRSLILGDHCKFYISRLGIAAIYNYFKSHVRVERDSLLSGSRLISIAHEKIEVFSLGREWSDIAC
jgi:hypothetical protein